MPVYEVMVSAKVFIKMDAGTPDEAADQVEALVEDASISAPFGFLLQIGEYPAQVFLNDVRPMVRKQLPDGTDPKKATLPTMEKWLKICTGEEGDNP